MPETMSEDMPDTDTMSDTMPDRMSEDMPDIPDRMPNRDVRRYAR